MKPPSPATRTAGRWRPPIEATVAVLELTAAEDPDLLDFTAHALTTGAMGFAMDTLADALGVTREGVGPEIGRACKHLDRLEKRRGLWRDPAEIVNAPNLAALRQVCHVRLERTPAGARRNRLQKVWRRLEAAWELARTRAFIEEFIGPQPGPPAETRHADR